MRFFVERQGARLNVRIEELAGREQAVIEALRACRASAWACPSGECVNIGTMDAWADEGVVHLTLVPRAGASLSAAGIELCLRYMLGEGRALR